MDLVVAVCMILVAVFLIRSEWEKLQLDTVRYRIPTEKPLAFRKTEADDEPGLRLLFISDLHDYLPARSRPEMILNAIEREDPDAVLIGGDMITVSRYEQFPVPKTDTALNLIGLIAQKYPVYYGEGNHESRLKIRNSDAYAAYVSSLLRLGVRYLADTAATVGETGITVSGVSLEEQFYEPKAGVGLTMRLPGQYLEKKLPAERGRFQVLLLHSPAFLQEAAQAGVDLVLSGHMHGGTVRLPGGGGLMTPQYRFLVKECSGIFREKNTRMIVNRGLGTHSIKARINDLPELTVIDIVPSDGTEKEALKTGRADENTDGSTGKSTVMI